MPGRVLVVDDVTPNVKLLEAKLGAEYFEVLAASNGAEAIEIARKEAPDIILLDIMMPGMDGFEVCRRLKADAATQHIPIIMVTALSDVADRVRGLEAGADDFLTKPVRDIALFARVRSLVRLKMLMDEWRSREQTSASFGVLPPDPILQEEDYGRARVLICEDSPIEITNMREVLSRDGNQLAFVASMRQALEAMARQDFDLVVAELNVGEDDALRLCSQLRSNEPTRHTPILLIGEEEQTQRLTKGLDLGANDYVIKPIDRNELLARVRTQLRRRRYQDRLRANYQRSLAVALIDQLTGVYNRNYLLIHLSGLMQRTMASGKPLAMLLVDVDYFKQVNDTHGHAAGDQVLRELATRMSHFTRNFDTVARYGGEEFVVVMPDTNPDLAMLVAERLRQRIEDVPVILRDTGAAVTVSVSIGVAHALGTGDTPDELVKRADQALYAAKRQGRNRVRLFQPSTAA
ncbi:MAG: PleD family two-component system response regulator [Proteobacteria bacterium]|nr:PleD family two-component system response regulator [Pseudomonadota bacterium]MBI3495788.1 PleD family two-component system response regulator [Pseudomonadota bacterium]